jgi:hypothetical protein
MYKVHKPFSFIEQPSSEPFRIYLNNRYGPGIYLSFRKLKKIWTMDKVQKPISLIIFYWLHILFQQGTKNSVEKFPLSRITWLTLSLLCPWYWLLQIAVHVLRAQFGELEGQF